MHRLRDLQQAEADFSGTEPRALVGAGEVADTLAVGMARRQQSFGVCERVGNSSRGGAYADIVLGEHRTTAGREIQVRGDDDVAGIARQEPHGVPIQGQRLADDHAQVVLRIEAHAPAATEQQRAICLRAREANRQCRAISSLRKMAGKAGHDRLVTRVLATKKSEAAKEFRFDVHRRG